MSPSKYDKNYSENVTTCAPMESVEAATTLCCIGFELTLGLLNN